MSRGLQNGDFMLYRCGLLWMEDELSPGKSWVEIGEKYYGQAGKRMLFSTYLGLRGCKSG